MKKKIVCLVALMSFFVCGLFAYVNARTGDSAIAHYLGTNMIGFHVASQEQIDFFIHEMRTTYRTNRFKPYVNLDKHDFWLVEQALNEHRIKLNDFYDVELCLYTGVTKSILVRIDSIQRDGAYSYSWWGIGLDYF